MICLNHFLVGSIVSVVPSMEYLQHGQVVREPIDLLCLAAVPKPDVKLQQKYDSWMYSVYNILHFLEGHIKELVSSGPCGHTETLLLGKGSMEVGSRRIYIDLSFLQLLSTHGPTAIGCYGSSGSCGFCHVGGPGCDS